MNEHGLMLVDEDNLCLISGDVHHLNRCWLVSDRDREPIVNEDSDDNTVFETNEKRLFLGRARNYLNIGD